MRPIFPVGILVKALPCRRFWAFDKRSTNHYHMATLRACINTGLIHWVDSSRSADNKKRRLWVRSTPSRRLTSKLWNQSEAKAHCICLTCCDQIDGRFDNFVKVGRRSFFVALRTGNIFSQAGEGDLRFTRPRGTRHGKRSYLVNRKSPLPTPQGKVQMYGNLSRRRSVAEVAVG